MKRHNYIILSALATGALLASGLSMLNTRPVKKASAATLTNNIDVTDTSESDIRSYYSAAQGKRGNELLTALKPILKDGHVEYGYSQVWDMYMITDRDWQQSPLTAAQLSSYSYSDNPYLVLLYRNDNYTSTAAKINDSHTQVVNREHCWAKSIGNFGENAPAGTDLHHLIASDPSNNSSHGNSNFGEPTSNIKNIGTAADHNNTGKSGNVTYNSTTYQVYEPQDCDKGDIARALMYMAARYSSKGSGTGEPYLQLVDHPTDSKTFTCDETHPGQQGTISTLLKWHREDPADDYEIHRNNLIYNNYQHNRNPFIDYPDLAEIAFGSGTTTFAPATQDVKLVGQVVENSPKSLTVSNPTTTFISGSELSLGSGTLTVTYTDNSTKEVALNDTKISVKINDNAYTKGTPLTSSDTGTVELTYTENNVSKSCTYTITVSSAVTDIQISASSHYLASNETLQLSATVLPTDASNKQITWSSKFSDVATVNSNGLVTAVKPGYSQIVATAQDGSGVKGTYDIYVYGLLDNEINYFHEFDKIDGFSSWSSRRAEHVVEYDDCTVTFTNANKAAQTITDIPVTADKETIVVTAKKDQKIESIEFICRQWADKTLTISTSISTDGTNYVDMNNGTNRFVATARDLPENTISVKLVMSSNSNVGFQALRIKYAGNSDVPPEPPVVTLTGLSIGDTRPTKTTYNVGETFDPTGLVVKAIYSDGSEETVTNYVRWNYGVLDNASITSVVGTYTEGDITETVTVTGITVIAKSGDSSSTPTSSIDQPDRPDPSRKDAGLPAGVIVGISIGGVVIIGAIVLVIILLSKKHK